MADQQLTLSLGLKPINQFQYRDEAWSLEEFPANDKLTAPEPDKQFVQTIINTGVIMPVIIAEFEDGHWEIRDGLRRIIGSRMALAYLRKNNRLYDHVEHIPVRIYECADRMTADAWTVILNGARSANPIAEAKAIMAMVKDGVQLKEISARTGRTKTQVDKLLQLGGLRRELQEATLAGAITPTMASKLAKEPAEVQDWAVNELAAGNKIVLAPAAPAQNQLPLARTWITARGDMPNLTDVTVHGLLEDAMAAKASDDDLGVYELFKVA